MVKLEIDVVENDLVALVQMIMFGDVVEFDHRTPAAAACEMRRGDAKYKPFLPAPVVLRLGL